jgi:hypothetical protein
MSWKFVLTETLMPEKKFGIIYIENLIILENIFYSLNRMIIFKSI